ncbi:30S ribosomal protein S19e [Halobium salinum]|uniref:Small ribosomal subunit protein eS19 n=1 Tax=Halobium salinum TaxID=1364940 RepID=A0ABD5PET0_9EURY|nr:30S ribosomal protein S19e [Halobium salinum]
MVTLYDVPAEDLIEAAAAELEGRIEEPEWVQYSKTGANKELPPQNDDFYYVRAASVLRKVATKGPIGVERLAVAYGGKKRGTNRYRVAKSRNETGAKKIIRTVLQDLEEEGFVETAKGEGRRITGEGQQFLDELAGDVLDELAEENPELERYA